MRIKTELIYDDDTGKVEIIKQETIKEDADKDWNLAKTKQQLHQFLDTYLYQPENVKKCRDLILKDLGDSPIYGDPAEQGRVVYKTIKKRFGDLEWD